MLLPAAPANIHAEGSTVNTDRRNASETRIVALDPGMYIVRFNSIPAAGEGAILSIAPSEDGVKVDFFTSEGVRNNTLLNQSDIVVVRCAGGEGNLLITSICRSGAKTVGARIDTIAGAVNRPGAEVSGLGYQSQRQGQLGAPSAAPSAVPLKLSGHIEYDGDVVAQPGQWLGDPNSRRRLEGFSLDWTERPEEVDLAYSCVIGGLGRSPAVLSGGYCGSRQRAAPITAITVSLVGKRAADYQLQLEVVFAGCPPQKLSTGVECRGLTGREQLVAIRAAVAQRV